MDDNATNRYVLREQLKAWECRYKEASSGGRALEELGHAIDEKDPFEIAIIDMQMPEMDGYAATREIRNLKLETRNSEGQISIIKHPVSIVPIVAMTAHVMKGDREKCLEAGMDDYLSKPVKPQKLSDMLNRWLAKQNSSQ